MELSCSKKTIGIIKRNRKQATENKLDSHKKVCDYEDFCNVVMPFEDTKILEFNQY